MPLYADFYQIYISGSGFSKSQSSGCLFSFSLPLKGALNFTHLWQDAQSHSSTSVLLLQFRSQLHPSHCSAKRLGVTLPGLPLSLTFPCGSASKKSACNVGDLGLIPGLGRSPGERKGYPLQYSSLENSMDCIIHGVAESQIQLSNFHFYIQLTNFSNHIQRSPTTSFHFWLPPLSRTLSSVS